LDLDGMVFCLDRQPGRQGLGRKSQVLDQPKLPERMVKLEQSPERVKSFFQDPRVKYAA
jgi:hypothetical protein